MSYPAFLKRTRRLSPSFRASWAKLSPLQKVGAALLIAGIALGCVVLALGALAVGHSLGALVLMLVVWLATAGAIALPFLQAFGISVLFGLVVNALFLIARAIRGR